MIEIKANGRSELLLGRQGENLARAVVFDVADWAAEYGSGTAELLVQRPGDETLYPAALVQEGDTVRWVLTAADTFVSGRYGRAELRYLSGGAVVKSRTWLTMVDKSMAGDDTSDPPWQTWVDQVLAAGAAASESADAAEDAKDAAAKSAEDAKSSATEAGNSAAAAAKSAGVAEDAKAAAGKSATDAQSSATEAGKSAAAAAKSAEVAEAAKDAAEKSATDAQGSAQDAKNTAEDVRNINIHPPHIGDNGKWYLWDTDASQYVDSGINAVGPRGDPGITTMSQSDYDAALAAGTLDADTWYGVYPD